MIYLAVACRCAVALVFAVSAGSKVRNRAAFAAFESSVRGLRLLPRSATRPITVATCAAELAVVPLVAVPATADAGLLLAAALLAAFSAVISTVLARRGTAVACRCFGSSGQPLGAHHIIRNAVLAAVAVGGVLALPERSGPIHPGGFAVALLAGAVLALLAVTLDDAISLFRTANTARR